MTVRDFAKVAKFEEDYAALNIFDPSGMISVGHFNSVYKLNDDNPVLDYEIISIKGNFYIRIDIDEETARKIGQQNEEARNIRLYGRR